MSITIENKNPSTIFIRLSSDGINPNDWLELKNKQKINIPRKEGNYVLDLGILKKEEGIFFKLNSPGIYFIDDLFLDLWKIEGDDVDLIEKELKTEINEVETFKELEAAPDQIIVKNMNKSFIYEVRISAQGGESEEWFKITQFGKNIWERKAGNSYHLEWKGPGNDSGVTHNVRSGEVYTILDYHSFIDSSGSELPFSGTHFRSAELNLKSKKSQLENDESQSLNTNYSSDSKIKFVIVNDVEENIYARIQKDIDSSDDYFLIKFGEQHSFFRNDGIYILEIVRENVNSHEKYRYYLKDEETYTYRYSLYKGSPPTIWVAETSDQFNSYSSVTHPKKKKEKMEEIIINNLNSNYFFVRLQSRGKGTEDLNLITSGASKKWSRENGKYLIEVICDNLERNRFYVNSDNIYNITEEKNLINDRTKEIVSPTNDNVFLPCYLDKIHDEKDDDNKNSNNFTDQINSNAFQFNNQEKEKKPEESNEKIEVKDPFSNGNLDVPYFKDVKPNYSGNGLFTDETFPPDDKTINSVNRLTGEKNETHLFHGYSLISYPDTSNFVFKRPIQIWGKKYALFKDEIECEDVKQGEIGNCYFVSVLAALARRPELIERLFKTRSANPNGFYEIYYFEKNGEKRLMFLDDFFLRVGDQKFFSAQPNGAELWVLLLEKCFAKYEGGYTNIHGGISSEVFQFLTGAIVRDFQQQKIENSWDELVSALKKGHICTAASLPSEDNTDKHKSADGIIFSHAYSLISAKEYNNGKIKIRLVELRNPHGTGEWKGAFSDESSDWTPELEAFFNLDEALGENGIFWMPFDKFTQLFRQVTICYC